MPTKKEDRSAHGCTERLVGGLLLKHSAHCFNELVFVDHHLLAREDVSDHHLPGRGVIFVVAEHGNLDAASLGEAELRAEGTLLQVRLGRYSRRAEHLTAMQMQVLFRRV